MRPTAQEIMKTAIDKMFEICGYDVKYEDVLGVDEWWAKWTMTEEQNEEWKDFLVDYFVKKLKMKKSRAISEAAFFSLMWGLKFDKNPFDKK